MRTNGDFTNENRATAMPSASNFFRPVHVHHESSAGFETVEQFVARGGVIQRLKPGDSSENMRDADVTERRRAWGAGKLVTPT